jgi:guanine deaminase
MHHHHDHLPAPVTAGETAHLRRAVELAVENASAGRLPFGALVVQDGRILATGVNTTARDHDPTAHAEVAAVRSACRRERTLALPGATLVSSCEPCALCHATAASAGIRRVVYAAPKEVAFEMLGAPDDPQAALLASMQHALRALAPGQVVHGPVEDDRRPFEQFLAVQGRP